MGVQKKTRKFAQVCSSWKSHLYRFANSGQVKRIIGRRDARLKENQAKQQKQLAKSANSEIVREMYADFSFLDGNSSMY
jgi:hypothetical protein